MLPPQPLAAAGHAPAPGQPIYFLYLHFHNAIRGELEPLAACIRQLEAAGEDDVHAALLPLRDRYRFLEQVYSYHSSVEDEVGRKLQCVCACGLHVSGVKPTTSRMMARPHRRRCPVREGRRTREKALPLSCLHTWRASRFAHAHAPAASMHAHGRVQMPMAVQLARMHASICTCRLCTLAIAPLQSHMMHACMHAHAGRVPGARLQSAQRDAGIQL